MKDQYRSYSALEISQLGGDMAKRRFVIVPDDPHWVDARRSAEELLREATRADAESGHDQLENWRLSHVATVAAFFGIKP